MGQDGNMAQKEKMEKEEDEDAEGKGRGEKEESTDLFRGCANGGGEESDG